MAATETAKHENPTIEARRREGIGRGEAARLRREGRVPAVLYASNIKEPVPLEISDHAMRLAIKHAPSEHFLVELKIEGEGKPRLAMVQEAQVDRISRDLLHVDFHALRADQKTHSKISIELEGTPEGVKQGGLVDQILFELDVEALPADLPELIHVDISHLKLGEGLHAGEVKLPQGVELHGDPNAPVVAVTEPRVAEPAEGGAAAAEPELVDAKGGEDEGEEADQ